MPSGAFLHPQNAPKSLAAGALLSPDPLAGLRGLLLRGGEKGGERKGGD